MSFKFPPTRPVTHTMTKMQVSQVTPLPMPTGILQRLEDFMYGKKDALYDLWLRYKSLPDYVEDHVRLGVHNDSWSHKTAKLHVYDFLSDAAKHFGMQDIMNDPEHFIEISFLNWVNTDRFEIRLVAKDERGNMLLTELEQLEATVELSDWHR